MVMLSYAMMKFSRQTNVKCEGCYQCIAMEVEDKSTTIMMPDSLTILMIEDLVLSKLFEAIIFEELNDQYLLLASVLKYFWQVKLWTTFISTTPD